MGIVISSGTRTVTNGQTLFQPNITNSGVVIISSGGKVTDASIISGGRIIVSSGGSDSGSIAFNGGLLYIQPSGFVYDHEVYDKGYVSAAGGRVFDTTVGHSGSLDVFGWSSGGSTVYGYTSYVNIVSGGQLVLCYYATGSDVRVLSGYVYVSSGGYLQEATIGNDFGSSKGAEVHLKPDGSGHLNRIYSNGIMTVSSAASATSTKVYSGGSLVATNGGVINYTSALGGVVYVLPGGKANNTMIESNGGFYVSAGANCSATTVTSGRMYLLSSATASETTLIAGKFVNYGKSYAGTFSGGTTYLSGGSSYQEKLLGGVMEVSSYGGSRGYANALTIQSATAYLNSDTSLNVGTVSAGGKLYVYEGARASAVDVKTSGAVFVKSGGYISGGGIYGSETIMSGGKAEKINVLLLGNLDVRGTAENCQIFSGGTVDVSGAFVNGSAEAGAKINVLSNGTATIARTSGLIATVSEGGILYVSNGTVRSGDLKGGYMNLSSGAYLSRGYVSSGSLIIGNGCSAANVDVIGTGLASSSTAKLLVTGNARTSKGYILGSQASLQVYSNGFADSMCIESGASATIEGTIDTCFVSSGGKIIVSSGAVASRTTIGSGGTMTTVRGALATITIIGTGGELVLSSGTANTVNINGGLLTVSHGSATDCHVWEGGRAVVHSYGVIAGSVESGGTVIGSDCELVGLTVSSGGRFTGTADLRNASQVLSFASGGILDFDISSKSFANLLVRGLNKAANVSSAVYTLTVSGDQNKTTYKLADGAAGFDSTITVKNTEGTSLGTLKVGNKVRIGDLDYTLDLKGADNVLSVTVEAAAPAGSAKSDIDGNGISDVMFVWTGNNYAHGYWMNGTNTWQSANSNHPAEWENLGCHDMTGDGKADSVLVGNVEVEGAKGAYIGYYADANDLPDGSTWVNIGYLNNADDIAWKNKVGNLTGNAAGVNSIVWYAPELYALGVWKDGKEDWATLSGNFGGDAWKLVGCGDFDGDGKDSVLMTYNDGQMFYAVGIDGTAASLGSTNWSGWEVRAIGDFSGDGRDDIVVDSFVSLAQLDAEDWFVVGAGDYNGDAKDDLLVRQYSTGMLGYYDSGDTSQWVELGRGVDMAWTVIA